MTTLGVCAAALLGIAVTTLIRPLSPHLVLLAGGLSVIGVTLAWHRRQWRRCAVLACALSLGAARGSQPG